MTTEDNGTKYSIYVLKEVNLWKNIFFNSYLINHVKLFCNLIYTNIYLRTHTHTHTHIYIHTRFIYIYIYITEAFKYIHIYISVWVCKRLMNYIYFVYIYMCVYLGIISSLMQISLNIIDILCLHIFFWIRSNSRITFIVFGENRFRYCP